MLRLHYYGSSITCEFKYKDAQAWKPLAMHQIAVKQYIVETLSSSKQGVRLYSQLEWSMCHACNIRAFARC